LERSGYSVFGIDTNEDYVAAINNKSFSSPEPLVNDYLQASKNFVATTNYNLLFSENVKVLFLVLPTPSLPSGEFSHHYIDEAAARLMEHGPQTEKHYLIINSTTMPGYCDSLQKKLAPFNYTVLYNPEFIAQGSIIRDQLNPDQVLIGEEDEQAGILLEGIYKKMCHNQPAFCHMSRVSAEITKLATNCFLTTKIAFANAIGDIALKAGGEPEKILGAIGVDSRIGNKYFKYGFGFGGPCFPRDNKAFTQFANNFNYKMLISEATDEANKKHAGFLFDKWKSENENKQSITFDSVTYKKGTDILEESQQLKLAVALAQTGKKVIVREKAGVVKKLKEEYGDLFTYQIDES
ncbi:MAG: UDP-glucose/GDP-mannose dehydrogenase family protein, partial [Bacteroidia bacterium]|nr:UDP-glucose/GDP-mannose dehydrogenase family protein [Bacteroidia bacterium]